MSVKVSMALDDVKFKRFKEVQKKLKNVGFDISLTGIVNAALDDYNELLESILKDIIEGKNKQKSIKYHIVGEIEK